MLTILYYVDWRGGFVDNLVLRRPEGRTGGEGLLTIMYYVDGRGGFVDNLVLRRREGRVC